MITTQYKFLEDLTTKIKLNLTDLHKHSEICLSEHYFLYSNEIWNLDNLGPISLSIMLVILDCFPSKQH